VSRFEGFHLQPYSLTSFVGVFGLRVVAVVPRLAWKKMLVLVVSSVLR
jgi:hypothetical protein